MELLAYEPELIISFSGYNDAVSAYHYRDMDYPPGTPESFDHIEKWVDDIRRDRVKKLAWKDLFDEAFQYIDKHSTRLYRLMTIVWPEDVLATDGYLKDSILPRRLMELAKRSASRYIQNMANANDLARQRGARFYCILKPSERFLDTMSGKLNEKSSFVRAFYEFVAHNRHRSLFLLDFRNVFKPQLQKNASNGDLFLDSVHLTDKGNFLVANEISNHLRRSELLK